MFDMGQQLRHTLTTVVVVLLAPLTTAAIAIGGVELPDPLRAPLEDLGVLSEPPAEAEPPSRAGPAEATDEPGRETVRRRGDRTDAVAAAERNSERSSGSTEPQISPAAVPPGESLPESPAVPEVPSAEAPPADEEAPSQPAEDPTADEPGPDDPSLDDTLDDVGGVVDDALDGVRDIAPNVGGSR